MTGAAHHLDAFEGRSAGNRPLNDEPHLLTHQPPDKISIGNDRRSSREPSV
jgi:hypothetical protein